tara:strand:- start:2 stop:484 length:483 start_codon:yes stop_codon:yes gene_type:complete
MSNIEKIRKMAKGIYNRPIQVGYTPKSINERKEGEIWEEPSGRKFTLENGKRKQLTKIPPRGFDKCNGWEESDCEKLILKTIDQQTYNRMGRCRVCQLEFEADLHRKGKWQEWVTDMEKQRWESIMKEYNSEMESLKDSDPFDKRVANALSDENIKSAMK